LGQEGGFFDDFFEGGIGFGVVSVDVLGVVEASCEGVVVDDSGGIEAPAVSGDGFARSHSKCPTGARDSTIPWQWA